MKTINLGIAIILFGIALILTSSGPGITFSVGFSFAGLIVAVLGYFKNDGTE